MLEKDLESFGLTVGEAKAYIALIVLGPSTVGPIAKKSSISYSKIYEVLERLIEKGLVSIATKEKTKHYQAVAPSRIAEFLEKQEAELTAKKEKLRKILPELKRLVDTKPREEAEVFIGLKGLKTAYELLVQDAKDGEEIYYFYPFDKKNQIIIDKFYGELPFYKQFKWKGIATKDYKFTHFTKEMHKNIKFKMVGFPLPGNIDITKDKVLQVTFSGNPIAVLIHSKEMASHYRAYFEHIWDHY